MNQKKIAIIDLLAERGHIHFVKSTIEILSSRYEITFISSNNYIQTIDHKRSIGLNNKLFEKGNKLGFFINQIKLIREVRGLELNRYEHIIFTGFENITFSLFKKKNNSTFLYIHNNLDRRMISKLFFYLLSKNYTFMVFEDYIRDFLIKNKRSAVSIPYPIANQNEIQVKSKVENFIFAPNVNPKGNEFEGLVHFALDRGLEIYVKYKNIENPGYSNVIVKPYYDNYSEMLKAANFIAVDISYDYRVSAVFYDAMTNNKKIIFLNSKNLFCKEMYKLYKNNTLIDYWRDDLSKTDNKSFLNKHSCENIIKKYNHVFE